MIRRHIIGFDSSDDIDRSGSCVIFSDGRETVIIDGYTGVGKRKLIARLKKIGCRNPWLYLTHAHGDHYDGLKAIINDSYFKPKGFRCYDPASIKAGADRNGEIRGDRNALIEIINLCKEKGIPVKYVHSSDSYVHGEIKFKVYREQPAFEGNSEDPHGWSYLNDGSLVFWFHELGTIVDGDGPMQIGEFCQKRGIHAKEFQIPHHGGNCNKGRAALMKQLGAVYCWDDNYCSNSDDFVQFGRKRCIEAGIKYYGVHGDINTIYFGGRAVIYKGGNIFRYTCSYKGKAALKMHTADVTRRVIRGSYGSGDTRTTNLLDQGYNPGLVQKSVNQVISTAKGILSGKLDYGKNQTRIARLDKELGSGYGQLVQDYINVLCGVRKAV